MNFIVTYYAMTVAAATAVVVVFKFCRLLLVHRSRLIDLIEHLLLWDLNIKKKKRSERGNGIGVCQNEPGNTGN